MLKLDCLLYMKYNKLDDLSLKSRTDNHSSAGIGPTHTKLTLIYYVVAKIPSELIMDHLGRY